MGSILATIAFKAFEIMWGTYEKKYKKHEKTQREIDLERMIKKQNDLLEKARKYCNFAEGKMKADAAEISRLKALSKHQIDENPYGKQ